MQFTKNTRKGGVSGVSKFLIKVFLLGFLLFLAVIMVDKIDFPAPNNKIEKIIPNENFKVIK
tara:strand:- start:234 stop:419 length:186 start_codon:yes stop_codon:yes gene_type:complete